MIIPLSAIPNAFERAVVHIQPHQQPRIENIPHTKKASFRTTCNALIYGSAALRIGLHYYGIASSQSLLLSIIEPIMPSSITAYSKKGLFFIDSGIITLETYGMLKVADAFFTLTDFLG